MAAACSRVIPSLQWSVGFDPSSDGGHGEAALSGTTSPPARARGRVGGRRRKLTSAQALHAQQLYDAGEHTVQQIADLLSVPRSTVYGHLDKTSIGKPPTTGKAPPPHA